MASDLFWINDISILWKKYLDFVPKEYHTNIEKLNAIARFSIYNMILLFLLRKFNFIFFALLLILISTIIFYKYTPDKLRNEITDIIERTRKNYKNAKLSCVTPTKDNPFMNVLLTDYVDRPNRPPACDIENQKISNSIENWFNYNLYQDVTDIYGKRNSQRQYYTTPGTTIPNDRHRLVQSLYGNTGTCRDSTLKHCIRFEDPRYKRPIYPFPEINPTLTKRSENNDRAQELNLA